MGQFMFGEPVPKMPPDTGSHFKSEKSKKKVSSCTKEAREEKKLSERILVLSTPPRGGETKRSEVKEKGTGSQEGRNGR